MVKGTSATKLSADGKAAVDQYRQYLEAQTAELVTATKAFTDAVDAGNLDAGQGAVRAVAHRLRAHRAGGRDLRRPRPRRSTPARATCRRRTGAATTTSSRSSGSTAPPTGLVRRTPRTSTRTSRRSQNLVKDVELQPAAIANGAVELLNEVSTSKITGEEERYSRTDLVDFEANVQGAEAAFDAVKPILAEEEPAAWRPTSTPSSPRSTPRSQPYKTGAPRTWRTPTSPRPTPRRCRR